MTGFERSIVSPADWRGSEILKRDDWVHMLSEADIAEVEHALRQAKAKDRRKGAGAP